MSSGKQPVGDDPLTGQNSSDEQTGLEEAIGQLSVSSGSRPYPQRFNKPDCIYYLRFGVCVYGARCRFNHPRNQRLAMEARRAAAGEYPQREGQYVCQYYMRTGMCKFGASCKYHHPRQRGESPSLVMPNIHGYPLRTNEKKCSHFMKTGQCKFGMTCKFHHPQPADAHVPASVAAPFPLPENVLPPTTYLAVQSLSVDSAEQYGMIAINWPVVRPILLPGSYFPGTYDPMLFSHGMVPKPDWTPYSDYASPVPSQATQSAARPNPVYRHTQLYAFAPAYTGPHVSIIAFIGTSSSTQSEFAFPQRPGQPECHYYMKYDGCKFGSSCKYHHPAKRSGINIDLVSAMGLPHDLSLHLFILVLPCPSNLHSERARKYLISIILLAQAMEARGAAAGEYPQREGQYVCQNEKESSHYIKTRQCKFSMTCKFNHPQPTNVQVPTSAATPFPLPEVALPPTTYPAMQSPSVDSAEQYGMIVGDWPVVRPTLLPRSYFPGTYGPMLFPPGMVPMPDWTPYPDSASSMPSQTTQSVAGPNPIYHRTQLYASAPAYTGPHMFVIASIGASSSSQNESAFPQKSWTD